MSAPFALDVEYKEIQTRSRSVDVRIQRFLSELAAVQEKSLQEAELKKTDSPTVSPRRPQSVSSRGGPYLGDAGSVHPQGSTNRPREHPSGPASDQDESMESLPQSTFRKPTSTEQHYRFLQNQLEGIVATKQHETSIPEKAEVTYTLPTQNQKTSSTETPLPSSRFIVEGGSETAVVRNMFDPQEAAPVSQPVAVKEIDWEVRAREALQEGAWKQAQDAKGRTYFFNSKEKVTVWNLAKELKKRHTTKAAK